MITDLINQTTQEKIRSFTNKECVIISGVDWGGLWQQYQQLALGLAQNGFKVVYINRTPQRVPTLKNFLAWLTGQRASFGATAIPEQVEVHSPRWLPPYRWLRPINRLLVRRTAESLNLNNPLVIAYLPTFNTIDFINEIQASFVGYINVHNYDGDKVIPDILRAERELIYKSDILFADSNSLRQRISCLSGGHKVNLSPPGVNFELFNQAFRGDEVERRKTIYYFGGVGPHLDLELYNSLAAKFKVVFAGVIDPDIRDRISADIEIKPPVSNSELPNVLKEADILTIFYKDSPYIRAVIPSKFFECLATNKPLLVSAVAESKHYSDVIYDVQGSDQKAIEIIAKLKQTETPQKLARRQKLAEEADWSNRLKNFVSHLYGVIENNSRED